MKSIFLTVVGLLGLCYLATSALVTQGWRLVVVLKDIGGKGFNLRYDMNAADYTTAATDRTTLLARLDTVTDLAIVSHSLAEVFAEDTTVYGTQEGENQAQITAKLVAPGKTVNVDIPGPVPGMFVAASGPDYDNVDPSFGPLQTYLSSFEAGALATVSDGEAIRDSATAGNFTGKRKHKGSKKG